MLYALCGISGSGKTTVLEAALPRAPHLARLVTATTRAPRLGEQPGRAYYFLTHACFARLCAQGELVCPIQYRGAWYATALADLRACMNQEALAVLRPDKLAALAAYTPIMGIYLERAGQGTVSVEDDRLIVAHQTACALRLTNIPGQLEQVVTTLLTLVSSPCSWMQTRTPGGLCFDGTHTNHC